MNDQHKINKLQSRARRIRKMKEKSARQITRLEELARFGFMSTKNFDPSKEIIDN
jgi:hypothetical protein